MENDSLKFEWSPKKLSDDEMKTAELKLTQFTGNVGHEVVKKMEQIKPEEAEKIQEYEDEENYLIKHLHRIP
jgi:hypothetical protein